VSGYKGLVLTATVFAVACAFLWRGIEVGTREGDQPSFHIDEAHKLAETYYFQLFFVRGDFDHPDWTGDFYARTNPPVAKYVFGLALAATGQQVHDRNLQDDFERLWRNPSQLRRLVADDQLRVTRYVSATYGALICAALFYVAYRAVGPTAGIVTVVLLLANPTFATTVRRGLADSILLFHLALIGPVAILATDALSRRWRRDAHGAIQERRPAFLVWTVLLPGLTIALAAGSKLNGALTAPVYALVLLLAAIRIRDGAVPLRRRLSTVFMVIGLTALVALVVFFGLNPYFYGDPIGRALETLRSFGDWMICQQVDPGEGLFSLRDRVAAVSQGVFAGRSSPLARWLGAAGSFGTAFAVTGLTYLALRCRRDRQYDGGTAASAMDVALVWSLVCLVVVTAWLPLAWDRYFLPPYLASALLTAIGLSTLPRVAGLLVQFVRLRLVRSEMWRLAVGAAIVPALTIILLASAFGRALDTPPEAWKEPNGISAWSDSPRLRRHLALRALQMGQPALAREQLERALAMLGSDPGDRSPLAVNRCCLLNEIAILRYRMGQPEAAIEAMREHIELLGRFRDTMTSDDPYVRAWTTRLIEQRKQNLAWLERS
jgi:hypothetical protein